MINSSRNVVFIMKIINIGDYSVGKTSLAVRYTMNKFSVNYLPTLGVDFHSKEVIVDEDTKIKMVLFDTVGQERLASLRKRYYSGAHGAVIVYDITRKESFDNIQYWITEIEEKVPNIPIIICGNKTDLEDQREVPFEEAVERWGNKGYTVLETSAKLGAGVNDVYVRIVKLVLDRLRKD
ncbi:MAG: Rab family GTPase [Candidatus Heimdallarchaeaceae archaeon]